MVGQDFWAYYQMQVKLFLSQFKILFGFPFMEKMKHTQNLKEYLRDR